tara:strand:+ start:204 stop:620 length:417 start_codon:yes stop_codon:yes gene_type:complete
MLIEKSGFTDRLTIGDTGIQLNNIHIFDKGEVVWTWRDKGNILFIQGLSKQIAKRVELEGSHFWEIPGSDKTEFLNKAVLFIIRKGEDLADLYIPGELVGYKEESFKVLMVIEDPKERLIRTRVKCFTNNSNNDKPIA